MSKKNISARKDELLILEQVLLSPEHQFMVIYTQQPVTTDPNEITMTLSSIG